jgi:hypothetical protein
LVLGGSSEHCIDFKVTHKTSNCFNLSGHGMDSDYFILFSKIKHKTSNYLKKGFGHPRAVRTAVGHMI